MARKLEALRQLPRFVLAVTVVVIVTAIYCVDLRNTPVYFGGDEAHFAIGAHAIATTGRNLNGDLLPVFFNLEDQAGGRRQPWGDTWYHPLPFYLIAIVVKVLPFSIETVRLPSALIGGVFMPLLIFLVARRLTGVDGAAMLAALVAALSPANVVMSRQALDYALPLPFVIGWLWSLHAYMGSRQTKYLVLGGFTLGVGCYSYIASWALMPVYLLMTWIVLHRAKAGLGPIVASGIAFVLPLLAAPLWIAAHSDFWAGTVARYSMHAVPKAGFLSTYLSLVDPVVLFARGGPSMTTSTARSGFVLLPAALFLAAGAFETARRRDWMSAVLVAGVLTAPLPAAFKGEPGMIQRATYLLPFLALLASLGCIALWRSRAGRAIAIAAIVAAPVQFGYFYFDYFTHYKLRSAFYYDPVAFRDVAAYLLQSPDAPAFYFTNDVDDASVKWRFYATSANRTDLLPRTQYIDPDDRPPAPPGSLLVTYDYTPRRVALAAAGWRTETVIYDVDNRPAAVIFRR
jgi:4-amino-4-deoxy-L-arabinose transferase-like glycosyltransferase